MEAPLETENMQCKNCKHYTGKVCAVSGDPVKEVTDPNGDCFTGLYDALDATQMLREAYDAINFIFSYYMDMDEDTKNIVALWIIGTYFHDNFSTFPYLFANAMRGSGKTRFLKVVAAFAHNAQLVNSLTEATMFRTTGTLAIDEFEGVGGKDKTSLRELLNSAYKKGTKVFRMKKKKSAEGESHVVEQFKPYRPIAMANIWGMEEVLGDRCISVVLERSTDLSKIKLVEDFEGRSIVKDVKNLLLKSNQCSLCSVVTPKNIQLHWNTYIKGKYEQYTTPTTYITLTTLDYTNYSKKEDSIIKDEEIIKKGSVVQKDLTKLFEMIDETKVDGRNLELFFPLMLIAAEINDDVLKKTLNYAKEIVQKKKTEEITESKDVLVYSLIAGHETNKFYSIKELTSTFRLMIGDEQNDWLNSRWVGRALKRLNLTLQKRRKAGGVEVMLNVTKAKEKEAIFKPK